MSGAGMSGLSPRGVGRSFSAPRVGPEKSRQFQQVKGSVTRGPVTSEPTRLHRWMMTGNQSSRVSEVAAIMTVAIRSMLSDMRKGK